MGNGFEPCALSHANKGFKRIVYLYLHTGCSSVEILGPRVHDMYLKKVANECLTTSPSDLVDEMNHQHANIVTQRWNSAFVDEQFICTNFITKTLSGRKE